MEPVLQCILVGLLKDALVVAQNLSIQAKRHFVHVHPLGWKRYQSLRLVVIRRPQAMGPSDTENTIFQIL